MIFNILASLVFGTLIGSFLNVVIWRLPKGRGLGGRSHCPNCHKQLAYFELLPLLSFISSRGRCRQCGEPISLRYPAVEAVTGLAFVAAWLSIEPSISSATEWLWFARALALISGAIVIFVIDLEHFLIMDKVLAVLGVILLAVMLGLDFLMGNLVAGSLVVSGLMGGLAAGAVFFLIWLISKGKWMGFGDVKLVALLGFAFGIKEIWILLLLAFWLGLAVSVVLLASRRANMASKLPFGTFLAAATVIMLFWGPKVMGWYLGIIGLG